MKEITVVVSTSTESRSLVLKDDDQRDTQSYCDEVKKLFMSSSIVALHTTSGSLIVRPSLVAAVLVRDIEPVVEATESTDTVTEEQEDIITD